MDPRPTRRHVLALAAGLAGAAVGPAHAATPIRVFAAASLANVLDEIGSAYSVETGASVRVAAAGSSVLARQIGAGAPADIFASASRDWMDDLAGKDLIRSDTRFEFAGNRLCVIGPAGAPPLALNAAELGARLGDGRLALAEPDFVPAGLYARAAFETLALWDGVAERLAPTDNVRAALVLVATGQAPLGVVYETDARIEPRVAIVARIPEGNHPPIRYPVAATRAAQMPQTAEFLAHLKSPAARAVLARHGFLPAGA